MLILIFPAQEKKQLIQSQSQEIPQKCTDWLKRVYEGLKTRVYIPCLMKRPLGFQNIRLKQSLEKKEKKRKKKTRTLRNEDHISIHKTGQHIQHLYNNNPTFQFNLFSIFQV